MALLFPRPKTMVSQTKEQLDSAINLFFQCSAFVSLPFLPPEIIAMISAEAHSLNVCDHGCGDKTKKCCSCSDERIGSSSVGKVVTHMYVDGKGFVTKEIVRWHNYCPSCRKMCIDKAKREARVASKSKG
jgi:hypothetical protein